MRGQSTTPRRKFTPPTPEESLAMFDFAFSLMLYKDFGIPADECHRVRREYYAEHGIVSPVERAPETRGAETAPRREKAA